MCAFPASSRSPVSVQLEEAEAEYKKRSDKLSVIQAEFAEVSKAFAEASAAQGTASDALANAASMVAAAEVRPSVLLHSVSLLHVPLANRM